MTNHLRMFAFDLVLAGMLGACGKQEAPRQPRRDDWVIRAKLEFTGEYLGGGYRLVVPYRLGMLGGGSDSSTYIPVPVNHDGSFELDLNQGHAAMLDDMKELPPNSFRDISIEPGNTLVMTVNPEIVDRRFKRLGHSSFADGRTGERLRLAYFDRAVHLKGDDLDIEIPEAGYHWIGENGTGITQLVPRPEQLVLTFRYEERR